MHISFDEAGPKLTKQHILNRVTDEQIYRRFSKDFPKRCCKRPWPGTIDNNDSFGFLKREGQWYWKDMAWDEAGDVFAFVQRLHMCDFKMALNIIAQSFCIVPEQDLLIDRIPRPSLIDQPKEEVKRKLIQVVRKSFRKIDIDWWNSLNISPNLLDYYNVRAAKEVWIDKELVWFHKEDNPIFYYINPRSGHIQVYRPWEKVKKRRFRTNMDPLVDVHGYDQCRIKEAPDRPLLITKSMKDVLFFRSFGYNAIANTAETNNFDPDFIRHIKKYCFPILLVGDNDIPGVKKAVKIRKQFDIPNTFICEQWKAKDPTDLWKSDYRKVYDLLNQINEHIEFIRRAGRGAGSTTGLCDSGKAT